MKAKLGRAILIPFILVLSVLIPALGAPTVQVIYPVGGANVEGVVNLRVFTYETAVINQTNIDKIDTVKFFRKADTTVKTLLVRIASTGEWSGAWNASSLTAGADTLIFRSINNTNVKTDSTLIVTITNSGTVSGPTVTVTTPVPGSVIAGTQAIAFTAAAGSGSITTREISVDGGVYTVTSSTTSHNLNTVSVAEGSHTVRFRITNSNGSAAESRLITYFFVNTPTVSWTTPAGGNTLSGRLILNYVNRPQGQATTASDSLLIDGQVFANLKTTGPDTINVSTLAEGAHTFQTRIMDSNGKTGLSAPVTLHVHNGPWVTLLTPIAGATLSGRVPFSYQDSVVAFTTLTSDSLLIDGKANIVLSLTGADTLNSTSLPDGEHSFQIKITDSKDRVGYSSLVTLLVRNSPKVQIDSALADSTVSGTLAIKFHVTPVSPSTVALRQISIDGDAYFTASSDSSHTLDTRRFSEGAHTAQIRGADDKGKEGLSRLVKFNVRNAPSVEFVSPLVDVFAHGIVVVKFTANAVAPDTIKLRQVSLGGGNWISTTTDSTYDLDTKEFNDGHLRIQLRVVDGSGKSAVTMQRDVVIDNAPPKISYPTVAYPENAARARKGVTMLVTAQGLDLGVGMDFDSAMALFIPDMNLKAALMHDDGLKGDKVKGDNVFSATVSIDTVLDGTISFSVRGRDDLGNDSTVVGSLTFDNMAPTLSFTLEPTPGNVIGALTGEVYVSRILMQGQFSDLGGAAMKSLEIVVRNDSGNHVNNSPEAIPLIDGKFRRIIELVPGKNFINLLGMDRAGNVDTVSATVTYMVPKETKIISSQGGSVFGADGSGVSVPAGVLSQAKEISVKVVDSHLESKPLDQKVKLVGVPHEFGPDGIVFSSPVTVTLSYTDADLDRNQDGILDFDKSKLTIVFWSGTTWIKAGDSQMNLTNHTLSVAVNHFTIFDIAEDQSVAPSNLIAFWDRNPIPGNSEFIFKVPKSGKVSLHILDMSGDVVKTLIQPATRVSESGSIRWDGSNVRGLFAGAGLYVYVFKYASDDGKTDKLIRKPVGLIAK